MIAIALVLAQALPVDVVGFSADDKQVAYIEHGVGEGSGYPWARLVVLDVAKNTPVGQPVQISLESGKEGDTEEAAVAQARKAAGDKWVAAKRVKLENNQLEEESGAPIGTITLKTKRGSGKKCDAPFEPLLLSLQIDWLDDDTPAKLAGDKKARACVTGCAIDQVWAHGKAALVFVRCGGQGFEGATTKLSALAGKLPYSLAE